MLLGSQRRIEAAGNGVGEPGQGLLVGVCTRGPLIRVSADPFIAHPTPEASRVRGVATPVPSTVRYPHNQGCTLLVGCVPEISDTRAFCQRVVSTR